MRKHSSHQSLAPALELFSDKIYLMPFNSSNDSTEHYALRHLMTLTIIFLLIHASYMMLRGVARGSSLITVSCDKSDENVSIMKMEAIEEALDEKQKVVPLGYIDISAKILVVKL